MAKGRSPRVSKSAESGRLLTIHQSRICSKSCTIAFFKVIYCYLSSKTRNLNKMNKLFYGDNLDVLRKFIRDETVDLCYIDPPCNSKRNYSQIYNNIGGEDRAQAQAFVDTWTWDDHANECFDQILTNKNGVQTAQSIALINGLEKVLGKGALFAYLVSIPNHLY
jgi:DNA modification methylase